MNIEKIPRILGISSTALMLLFIYLFITHNAPGFTNLPWVILIGGIYGLLYALAAPILLGALGGSLSNVIARLVSLLTIVALPLIFMSATVWDYYQPLALFDDAITALAGSWLLLILALGIALPRGDARMVPAALIALAGPCVALIVEKVSDPQPSTALTQHSDIFSAGEDGYAIYRIPGLLVVPTGSRLADGTRLGADRLLAFAEARRDGALDTGAIDLVLRHSDDGGNSWSRQRVACVHEQDDMRGKCGNATPLFDAQTGHVWLAYNLSGIPADLPEGPRPHSAHLIKSTDGGISWSAQVNLPFDNSVFGPGHGVQKHLPPAQGRLLLPAYVHGTAFAIYSDDHGKSWQRGADLGRGNEAEIAELPDGRLYMTTRHAAPIGRPPEPGRLFAISLDGGQTWPEQGLDAALPTPVCQASVTQAPEGALWFSNPAHNKARVKLTLRASDDGGSTWPRELQVYPGPAGYSQVQVLTNGDIALLYERGRVSYSEKISFARVSPSVVVDKRQPTVNHQEELNSIQSP